DAQEGVTEQDTKIAGLILDSGKAVIVAVNKWDAVEKDTNTMEQMRRKTLEDLKFMSYAPVIFLSALTGQRANTVLGKVKEVFENYRRRIPTGVLNEALADAQLSLQPPMQGGRKLKIYYATQQAICPPTFVFFVNDQELMHFAYERYLENHFRKSFEFAGTPLRFILRAKKKEDIH
ncbi:MAG: GTP-binding protein, partial [Eubacteriales bacterium]|nr:GTP-binding protein [Eubacteriales bacterium]